MSPEIVTEFQIALDKLRKAKEEGTGARAVRISIASVARCAGRARSLLYHPECRDVREQIVAARSESRDKRPEKTADERLRRDYLGEIAELRGEIRKLVSENASLAKRAMDAERELSEIRSLRARKS